MVADCQLPATSHKPLQTLLTFQPRAYDPVTDQSPTNLWVDTVLITTELGASSDRPSSSTHRDSLPLIEPEMRDAFLAVLPHLRAFALWLAGNHDRADDLVQQTLLVGWAFRETQLEGVAVQDSPKWPLYDRPWAKGVVSEPDHDCLACHQVTLHLCT